MNFNNNNSSCCKRARIDSAFSVAACKNVAKRAQTTPQINKLVGFVPYYHINDKNDGFYSKINIQSIHTKTSHNKNIILTKKQCNSLIYGYFRLHCKLFNVRIRISDLAGIIASYFGGDTFEFNVSYRADYSTMFFDLINANNLSLPMPNTRVTLNLKLNQPCQTHMVGDLDGSYKAMIGVIGYKNNTKLGSNNNKFFDALYRWQRMYAINTIDEETGRYSMPVARDTNPFVDGKWYDAPVLEENGFNVDNICYYYVYFEKFECYTERSWNMYEMVNGKQTSVSEYPTCDIKWGDTVSATMDKLNNSLIVSARIGEKKKTSHKLYEFDLMQDMNYIFLVTVISCNCEEIDIINKKREGMSYQLSMDCE